MTQPDEVSIKFKTDDSQLDATARKLTGFGGAIDKEFAQAASGGGLSGLFGKISQLGFGVFGLQQTFMGFKGVVGGLFSSNVEFENFNAEFKVLLGSADAAKQRLKELSDFGRTTPFELPEVVRASKTLETLTKGALSTGDGLRLVGDVASGTGIRIDELAMWFGRLYDGIKSGRPVGEAMMRLQELGAISGDTRNQIEAMQAAGVDGEVVWATMADSFSRFSGTMEEKSKTMGGALSNISDGFGQLKRNLMAGMFEAIKPGIMELANLLGNPALQSGATKIGEALGTGLAVPIKLLADGLGFVIPPLVDFVVLISGPIGDALGKFKDALPGIAKGVYDWAQNHKLLVAMITPVGAAILLVIDHWKELKGQFSKGIDFGKDLFGGIKEQFDLFVAGFNGDAFAGSMSDEKLFGKSAVAWGMEAKGAFEAAAEGLGTLKEALYAAEDDWTQGFHLLLDGDLSAAWTSFLDGFKDIGQVLGVSDEFGAFFDGIVEGFTTAQEKLQPIIDSWKPLFKDIFGNLKETFGPTVDAIKQDLIPALEGLGPAANTLKSAVIPTLQILGTVIGVALYAAITAGLVVLDALSYVLKITLPAAISLVAVSIQAITPILETVFNAFKTSVDIVVDVIRLIKAVFTGDWAEAWDAFTDIFKDAWEGFKRQLDIALDGMKAVFTDIIPELMEIGVNLVGGLFLGMDNAWPTITSGIQTFFTETLPGALGNVADWLVDVGWDVVRGLGNGIKAAAPAIVKAAIDFVSDQIPGWAKKALGIGSPSKVMIPIGKDVTAGLAVGIEDGTPMLYDAVENTAMAITDGFVGGFTSSVIPGTTTAIDMWHAALKAGLEEGTSMSTAAIETLFADLYQIIADSSMDIAGKTVAQDFLTGLVSEFGISGSLANTAVMKLIDDIMNAARGKLATATGGSGSGNSGPYARDVFTDYQASEPGGMGQPSRNWQDPRGVTLTADDILNLRKMGSVLSRPGDTPNVPVSLAHSGEQPQINIYLDGKVIAQVVAEEFGRAAG